MIAYLRGRVVRVGEDHAVLDVHGVGYLVHASARSLRRLPAQGETAELLIDFHLGEDAIRLYGFVDESERSCFRLLQSVQGVGARVALSLLGAVGPDGLAAAVASADRSALTRAPGVGARLAARIVAELKDRLVDFPGAGGPGPVPAAAMPGASVDEDALAALVRLGFGRSEGLAAIARVRQRQGAEPRLDALIREALRELSAAEAGA
jgi:Holliday junction DNA helicase RuvA